MDGEGQSGHMVSQRSTGSAEAGTAAHPGQIWGGGGGAMSSGSLGLISLSPATLKKGMLGRKYYTHTQEWGSEAELAPPASKERPSF